MKICHTPKTETLGYCHDCHNRARLEVTFSHRPPIRLCDRCGGFLAGKISGVILRNGTKIKPPMES